jgi:TolB-like protein/Tfp pilus assembly protein PilF
MWEKEWRNSDVVINDVGLASPALRVQDLAQTATSDLVSVEFERCIAKPLRKRYQTIAEVRTALESISGKCGEGQPSVAVLPFANMSRDADDEYFSDGLAEEIITALTQVSGLKVIARTSAFAFKGKSEDVRKIAEALGVTNLLEGSVRRAGSRLRVTAQLIHAADGTHLWSQRYDRELTDVFAVQDEIAGAIVGALRVKLGATPAIGRPHEPNMPAYEAFLKAKYQLPSRRLINAAEASARVEEYFKLAIALDPQWADPHAELSQLYFFVGRLGVRPLHEMVSSARAEARQALKLFPFEPMSHAVLGAIAASHDYDWEEAAEQFRLATTPQSLPPAVHDLYAISYLLPLGRFEEAIEQQAKAIAQDPLNIFWRTRQFIPLLAAEKYDRAIVEARKTLEFDEHFLAHWVIALAQFFQGNFAEAREAGEEAVRRAPWSAGAIGVLAGLLAQSGEKERAQKLIANMRGTVQVGMFHYYLVCRDIDAAIDWYERAIEARLPMAIELASAGSIKPLRSHHRWPKLARMMNLPERG